MNVTRKDLQQIKSPLDNAIKKLSLQDKSNKKGTISRLIHGISVIKVTI